MHSYIHVICFHNDKEHIDEEKERHSHAIAIWATINKKNRETESCMIFCLINTYVSAHIQTNRQTLTEN